MKFIGPKELLENLDRVVAEVEGGETYGLTYTGVTLSLLGGEATSPESLADNSAVANSVFASLHASDPEAGEILARNVEAAEARLRGGV